MNTPFETEFEALIETFSEMLIGSSSPEMVEKIKMWSIYNHIHKTMPALASHWNQAHPESRVVIRQLFEEVRALHLALKEENQKQDE
jgi:hypothetical protein